MVCRLAGTTTVADTLVVPAKASMDTPRVAEAIEKGVDEFMEALPILMKTLDDVAKVHPFISGASLLSSRAWGLVVINLVQLPSLRSRLYTRLR